MSRVMTVLACLGLAMVVALPAQGSIVTVTYTGDNVVAAFYKNGAAPMPVALGGNANNWTKADTAIITLVPFHNYSVIFRVKNSGNLAPANPAAFLAQIQGGSGTVLSSGGTATWQWAFANDTPVANFDLLTWTNATSYGKNGTSPWTTKVNTIDNNAQWIWANKNFAEPENTNRAYDDLWIKGSFNLGSNGVSVIPEPASLLVWSLLASCVAGLAMWRRAASRR